MAHAVNKGDNRDIMGEELRITVEDLIEVTSDVPRYVGIALSERKDMSFQDMQSIARGFGRYFGYVPARDERVNNIIVAQACRHAMVHAGGIVDDRLVRQVQSANPRTVKPTLTVGSQIRFSPEEIDEIGRSMQWYIQDLADALGAH